MLKETKQAYLKGRALSAIFVRITNNVLMEIAL